MDKNILLGDHHSTKAANIRDVGLKSILKESELVDLIHYDLYEFDGIMTRGTKRYFITLIENCSDFTLIYLVKNKSDALDAFK